MDEMWGVFATKIDKIISDYVPLNKGKRNYKNLWMTTETASVIDKKRRSWIKYLNCKSAENYSNYTLARNEATSAIRYAKRDYERNVAKKCKEEPKLFWNYVRNNTKIKEQIGDLKTSDGQLVDEPQSKANILNSFFSSVFTKEDTNSIPTLEPRSNGILLSDLVITPESVRKKIKSLKQSKSPGPDGIHNKLLIELCDIISELLAIIFNKSITTGIVPAEWKIAHVTPIFKSGNKQDPGNYRPVSLTSICSRLLESLVKEQLMLHMETNNLFTEHQFGFRGGHSCVTQLLQIFEEWSKAVDNREPVDILYLDFRKAFDTVPHKRLNIKLQAYGITGNILEWINHFLQDRKQRVSVSGHLSEWADVVSGIPQGSVLGPTLFLIFINDLPDRVNNLVKIFADDTKLYSVINDNYDVESLQEDLDNLAKWSDEWKLGFNAKKCKSLHLGSNNVKHKYNMLEASTGSRVEIEQVEEEKDLGVTFQSDLKFNSHIVKCVNKANRMIGIIRRTFTELDKSTFLTLYKTLIRPYMEYATAVWSPYYQKDILILENTQRRATKLVREIKDKSYEERMLYLGLPTLKYRRARNDLVQVYKIINKIDNLDKGIFFNESNVTHTRGHNFKLQKQQYRLSLRGNAFSQRIIEPWNRLDEYVVQSKNLNQFKSNLNKHWKNHPLKFDSTASACGPTTRNVAMMGHHSPRENIRPGEP